MAGGVALQPREVCAVVAADSRHRHRGAHQAPPGRHVGARASLGNPLRIAEQAATLDHVSEGRFDFGVGRSGLPGAYEGYNIPYGESRERFYEYLDIILTAWTNERFSYDGKYFSFDDVCLVPKPYQSPHPPIRVAATTPDTFPVIAKMGYPVFIGVRGQGMSQVAEQVDAYEKAWKDAGHEGPADVSLARPRVRRGHQGGGADRPGGELHEAVPAAGRAARQLGYARWHGPARAAGGTRRRAGGD